MFCMAFCENIREKLYSAGHLTGKIELRNRSVIKILKYNRFKELKDRSRKVTSIFCH